MSTASVTITELIDVERRLTREARKWVSYLDGVKDKSARESELARKLLETYLEGKKDEADNQQRRDAGRPD